MKKQKRHNLTTLSFSGTFDEIVESLKSEFDYYSENYTNLKVDYDSNYEGGYEFNLYGDRLETDAEEALRIKQEEEYDQRQFEFEKRQYEALKAKFEKN
jgi:hypothetical protein